LPGLLSRARNLSPGASCYRAELGRGPAIIGSDEHAQTSGPGHGDRQLSSARRGPDSAEAARRVAPSWTRSHPPPASVFPRAQHRRSLPRRRVRRAHIRTPARHRAPGPGTWKDPGPRRRSNRGPRAQNRPACAATAATRRLRPVRLNASWLWSQAHTPSYSRQVTPTSIRMVKQARLALLVVTHRY
jgi:hypothetical protein